MGRDPGLQTGAKRHQGQTRLPDECFITVPPAGSAQAGTCLLGLWPQEQGCGMLTPHTPSPSTTCSPGKLLLTLAGKWKWRQSMLGFSSQQILVPHLL